MSGLLGFHVRLPRIPYSLKVSKLSHYLLAMTMVPMRWLMDREIACDDLLWALLGMEPRI